MVKLIASDIDGTLLPEGTHDINPEIYDIIRELNDKGVIFACASGRELDTLKVVMNPVADKVYCIANNGARVNRGFEEDLSMLTLDWETVKEVITELRADSDCIFISANTPEGTYTDSDNEEMLDWLLNGYGLTPIFTDDILKKPLEVMKLSIFMKPDAVTVAGPYIDKYSHKAHVTVAGDHWMDFTHIEADKGIAFRRLIARLGIRPEETWAFGDNSNDISMIRAAGVGFCAPGGRKEVREASDVCLEGDLWDAVINTLKTLLLRLE